MKVSLSYHPVALPSPVQGLLLSNIAYYFAYHLHHSTNRPTISPVCCIATLIRIIDNNAKPHSSGGWCRVGEAASQTAELNAVPKRYAATLPCASRCAAHLKKSAGMPSVSPLLQPERSAAATPHGTSCSVTTTVQSHARLFSWLPPGAALVQHQDHAC